MRAMTGRAIPPFTMRGASGWYRATSCRSHLGELTGTMAVGTERIELRNATDPSQWDGYLLPLLGVRWSVVA